MHAAYALREIGLETIMINCNPETVSTDWDTSDRLYFEPLTAEDVLAIVRRETTRGTLLGCIVQYGGQTPLKLSEQLSAAGVPTRLTSPRTASVLRPCCAASACASPRTAWRARPKKPKRSPTVSAIRW